MTTVSDIYAFLDSIAPYSTQESWDKSGLNCGRSQGPVSKVLLALDPFLSVCQEAVEKQADLLLTHHPLLFHPGFFTDENQQGRCALLLAEHHIAHLCAHTNYDCAPGGVNDILAQQLGLREITVTKPLGQDAQGRPWGLLRHGFVEEMPLETFLARVKAQLHCPGLRFCDGGKAVRQVAVGGGACASELTDALLAGCDTFVTADVKYNQFWDARDLGLNLIDAGHFHTENPSMAVLAQQLQAAFPQLTVELSTRHQDCVQFYL